MSAHCEKHGCNLVYTEYPFMECPMCATVNRVEFEYVDAAPC